MAVDTIEKAIFSILTNDETVASLVSTRVFPMYLPEDTAMPAITYQQISTPDKPSTNSGKTGLKRIRLQFNCWSTTVIGARTLATAVDNALDQRVTGTGTVQIRSIEFDDEGDLPVLGNIGELQRYAKRLDYLIWFVEL